MTAFDCMQHEVNQSTADSAYNGTETLWGFAWNVDSAMVPANATIRAIGIYNNDPGINAVLRVRYTTTPVFDPTAQLLLEVPLVADQGYFSLEIPALVFTGQGWIFLSLQGDPGFGIAGMSYPRVIFSQALPPPPTRTHTDSGGFGSEAFGDPFGAGGPLHVVRVRAIEGQTIRVVFDEEPLHISAAGINDALNPSNYDVRIVSGQGADPEVVGVKRHMVTGPTMAVSAGDERAFDIQTDRQLIRNLIYEVTVVRVVSKFSGTLGVPFAASCPGMVLLKNLVSPAHVRDVNDIANDPETGGYAVDQSGDLANEGQVDSYKKRVTRRLMTQKNAFRALPGYGLGQDLKAPMSIRRLADLKLDMIQQIQAEPETDTVKPILTLDGRGFLSAQIAIKTKKGAFVTLNLAAATGEVVIT